MFSRPQANAVPSSGIYIRRKDQASALCSGVLHSRSLVLWTAATSTPSRRRHDGGVEQESEDLTPGRSTLACRSRVSQLKRSDNDCSTRAPRSEASVYLVLRHACPDGGRAGDRLAGDCEPSRGEPGG